VYNSASIDRLVERVRNLGTNRRTFLAELAQLDSGIAAQQYWAEFDAISKEARTAALWRRGRDEA